jgi:hypothetical protein
MLLQWTARTSPPLNSPLGAIMSVGNRLDEAIVKLYSNDLENALIQVSIAIDATAKKKFKNEKKVGNRIRLFVNEHEDLINHFAMNGQLKLITPGGVQYGSKGTIGQIMYKSIRCALLHEGDISSNVVFKNGPVIGMEDDKFLVTDNMLWGLVVILIGEEVNSREKLKQNHTIQCWGKSLALNEYWGNMAALKNAANYLSPEELGIQI